MFIFYTIGISVYMVSDDMMTSELERTEGSCVKNTSLSDTGVGSKRTIYFQMFRYKETQIESNTNRYFKI